MEMQTDIYWLVLLYTSRYCKSCNYTEICLVQRMQENGRFDLETNHTMTSGQPFRKTQVTMISNRRDLNQQ